MFVRRYIELKSNKIEKSINLFCMTDLHFTSRTREVKLSNLLNKVREEKPDYVVFTGDLIDSTKKINDKSLRLLFNFFDILTNEYKVIFIKGNHDTKDEEKEFYNLDRFFKSLELLDNFYYLNNNHINFKDICFYGFELYNDYYYEHMEKDDSYIIKCIENINNQVFKTKYNVLLFHSPILLFKENVLNKINNVDLILCGHMHNGIVPDFLDRGKSTKGIISPRKGFIPKYSRNGFIYNNINCYTLYPLSFKSDIEKYGLDKVFRPGYTIISIQNN